jgi:hypothetical protein
LEYNTTSGVQKLIGPFSKITKKGRIATEGAYKYIKLCNSLQQKGWFNNESLKIEN